MFKLNNYERDIKDQNVLLDKIEDFLLPVSNPIEPEQEIDDTIAIEAQEIINKLDKNSLTIKFNKHSKDHDMIK
jgi:hypothetical protein